ncbi:MAG: 2Fe-2S iron-sulfur cluster-binding protein [Acidobacteriota bacterium]
MDAVETNTFEGSLTKLDDHSWSEALESLCPLIHPVDQDATRIWFAFWPLRLLRMIQKSDNIEQLERQLELKGCYRLEEQLDSSVHFLFGSRYWPQIKEAVSSHAETSTSMEGSLADQIQAIARELASSLKIPDSHLIGITAVALMALRQVGLEVLSASSTQPVPPRSSPDQILRTRAKKGGGLLSFLRTVNSRYTVVVDERDRAGFFKAIHGQDVSMASGADTTDYRPKDPRCGQGPIPFQCRTGTCGTCWMGVLSGKERLSPVSDWERDRLQGFGYDFGSSDHETHPPIRLSCQAQCLGDLSVTVAPWNGILNVQRFDADREPGSRD